jgi:hypothetical protein
MAKKDLHVVLENDRWGIKREGSLHVFRTFDAKAKAIDIAHEMAGKEGIDVVVHGKTGQPFQEPRGGPESSLNEKAIRRIMRSAALVDFRRTLSRKSKAPSVSESRTKARPMAGSPPAGRNGPSAGNGSNPKRVRT